MRKNIFVYVQMWYFVISKMTLLSLTMYKIYWMPAKYTESVQNLLSMIKNYQNKLHAYNFILANR